MSGLSTTLAVVGITSWAIGSALGAYLQIRRHSRARNFGESFVQLGPPETRLGRWTIWLFGVGFACLVAGAAATYLR